MLNGMEFQTVRAASLKAVRLTAVQNEKTANKRGIQTIIDRLETFTVNDLYPGRLPLALKLDIEIRLSDDVNQSLPASIVKGTSSNTSATGKYAHDHHYDVSQTIHDKIRLH